MHSFFKLNNLSVTKPKHIQFFTSLWDNQNAPISIQKYLSKHKKNIRSFYITNLTFKQELPVQYIIELNQKEFVLMEEIDNQTSQYCYTINTHTLTSNSTILGKLPADQFLKRFQDILSDISANISVVYEHTT
ncbi:hypothetical protein DID75_01550 [Candidatus Marinamargulisbacteria bacterium SCGC AG-410-N11]|nr:hypothetical protein DID75_01550 [Candidatus Marinamargulisbacteria bacterium SCGC AG-410-N11]